MSVGRNQFSPHPYLGLPPRWNVGDLPVSYATPIEVLNTATNALSNPYNPQANSVAISVVFVDNSTFDLSFQLDDGTGNFVEVKRFIGVSVTTANGLAVGEFDTGISLGARNIKVQTLNKTGAGAVSIRVTRMN